MVSVRTSELGPLGWDVNVTKRQLFLQKVSSKLGTAARTQGKGSPPGQGNPVPRQAQSDGSTLGQTGQSAAAGSPTKPRQSQSQSQGES